MHDCVGGGRGAGESVEALERHLKEGGYHYDGKDEHANGFEPASPHRVGVFVASGDEFARGPYDRRAEEVQRSVDERGEHRERACERYDGDFPREEDGVGG